MQISNDLGGMSKSTDLYLTKYDEVLLLGDFNAGVQDSSVKDFFVQVITLQVWLRDLDVLRTLRNLLV